MSRALVVYESMYGNTGQVAVAIGDGLAEHLAVEVVEVGDAPAVVGDDVALLVVGCPTHGHAMPTEESRASAARNDAVVSSGPGMREWLEALPPPRCPAAAFTTRIKGPRLLWGTAAPSEARALARLGVALVAEPEDFLVLARFKQLSDVVVDGELARAQTWGEALGRAVRAGEGP